MRSKIEIDNVDEEMLEKQRLLLVELLWKIKTGESGAYFEKKQVEALQGVVNMLDHWSDRCVEKAAFNAP